MTGPRPGYTAKREICKVCRRDVIVLDDGTLRSHFPTVGYPSGSGPKCEGSRKMRGVDDP